MISGPFTNWNPMKMMKIEDFCMLIDQKFPNLIGTLLHIGCKTVSFISTGYTDYMKSIIYQHKKSSNKSWSETSYQNNL